MMQYSLPVNPFVNFLAFAFLQTSIFVLFLVHVMVKHNKTISLSCGWYLHIDTIFRVCLQILVLTSLIWEGSEGQRVYDFPI